MYQKSTVDIDLTSIRRNSKAYIFTFEKEGSPINLTGSTITFSLKENREDTDEDAILLKHPVILNAAAGTALLELTPEEMDLRLETYWYDVQLESEEMPRVTVMRGMFRVTWNNTEKSYA